MGGLLRKLLKAKPTKVAPRLTHSKLDSTYIASAAKRGCAGCPLDKEHSLQHPKMLPTGAKHPDVYILGEAPGADEDAQGKQFVGKSGRVLRNEIPEDWSPLIRWNNTIRCRPPKNREPSTLELECCRKLQEDDIAKSKPKLVMGFGNVPLNWLLPNKAKITAWRGRYLPVRIGGHACWYTPMYHPSYVMRAVHGEERGEAVGELFRRDVSDALDRVLYDELPDPIVEDPTDKDKGVILLKDDLTAVLGALEEAMQWDMLGVDIETLGLRPYSKDAKVLTCAVSNYDQTYAFPIAHHEATWLPKEVAQIWDALFELLRKVKPIAHNSKFEQEWLSHLGGDKFVHEVDWQDTMAQAYVLDEREGAKSLGDVSMQTLGLNIKALSPQLRMDNLDLEPLKRVLPYNAYDAKYLPLIFLILEERIKKERLRRVYNMMNCRAGPIAMAQRAGVVPDSKMAAKLKLDWVKRAEEAEAAIQRNKDVKAYVKENGKKFKATSNVDLPGLLHGKLGFKECEVGGGKVSTDEKVLKQIDHPVAKLVLELRVSKKLVSTYLDPLLEGGKHIWDDGLVHTNYNALLVGTGRLSSDDPNLQNFPRKEKEIRRAITAPKGYWMVAFDQGQIEARGIAWHSKDKFLIDALWNKYDIHGEWARKIALAYPSIIGGKRFLNDKDVMKEFRQEGKNRWVFPLFYGSALKSVAAAMRIPREKLSPLYDEFWDTFEGVAKWQQEMRKQYRKVGYVETLTGRRRHGPLSWNDIINSPIQGVASDIVVDAMVLLSRMAYEQRRPQLQWRMNIHDDLTFYLPDSDSFDDDLEDIAKVMIQPRYNFISTPLVVEVKAGVNWCDLEEVAVFSSDDYGHKREVLV